MTDNTIAVLGSTGSVGLQTLDVARLLGIRVESIAAGSSVKALEAQIREFSPVYCAVRDEIAAAELKTAVADTPVRIIAGADSASELISLSTAGTAVNAISGFAGLSPTLAAIEAKKTLALANKESLVAAGDIVTAAAKRNGVSILPVDSEHSAIFQCLDGRRAERLILTASGGPFFGKTRAELSGVTAADALRHPTWLMGKKITVDCATLMNKGLEVIEAARLFDMPAEKIDVVIHRESIIHSMVEYTDSAVLAQLSVPDMRLCISYALTYPERAPLPLERLDFAHLAKLTFFKPDFDTFTLLSLAYYALGRGGVVPAAMNGANEAAVELFLEGKIGFTDIFDLVGDAARNSPDVSSPALGDIVEADENARRAVFDQAAVPYLR